MAKEKTASRFVTTWDALAGRLGVTRRAIQDWRNDPRLVGLCPKARANGQHDVEAWDFFMKEHALKRADEQEEGEGDPNGVKPPAISGSVADWKRAEMALRVEQRRVELETMRGALLVASELELPLGATFVAIQNKLTQFPERVAAQVAGFTNVQEIIVILRTEIEADLAGLHAAEYLTTGPEELAKSLPFDDETAGLMDRLTFGGQDREAFAELVGKCARKVIERVGALMIARVRNVPETAHATTGQISEEAAEVQQILRTTAEKKPAKRRKTTKATVKRKAKARRKAEDSEVGE